MAYKIAVLASTNGTDLQAIIDEMKAGEMPGIELVGVLSNKADCYAIERARAQGYATFTFDATGKTREQFDEEMIAKLKELQVDLIVCVGYMRIFSAGFVKTFAGKIINVHPSLLPAFAGGMNKSVHEEVLKAGVKETGCTIHFVDESVDGGKIILQKSCPVLPTDTADTLRERVQALEKKWYPEVIRQFANSES